MDTTGFYSAEEHRTLGHLYAEPLAAFAAQIFDPQKPVFDLGCGTGTYCTYLDAAGFRVTGFEGAPDIGRVADYSEVHPLNLAHPFYIGKAQVLCLEVGEHIPEMYEQTLLDNLARTTDGLLLLSWAVPGQPGNGHVNCKPNDYIIGEMERRGLLLDTEKTAAARSLDFGNMSYFKNTVLVFRLIPVR